MSPVSRVVAPPGPPVEHRRVRTSVEHAEEWGAAHKVAGAVGVLEEARLAGRGRLQSRLSTSAEARGGTERG